MSKRKIDQLGDDGEDATRKEVMTSSDGGAGAGADGAGAESAGGAEDDVSVQVVGSEEEESIDGLSLTDEQRAIVARLPIAGERLGVVARAGAAKSTTARVLATKFPETQMLYVVFNKAMQLEAQRAMPSNVTCSTFSALAYAHWRTKHNGGAPFKPIMNAWEFMLAIKERIEKNRDTELEAASTNNGAMRGVSYFYIKVVFDEIVRICNNMPSETDTVDKMLQVVRENKGFQLEQQKKVCVDVLQVYAKRLREGTMAPLMAWAEWTLTVSRARHETHEVVLIDEAQDLNMTMVQWVRQQTHAGVILLGDPLQQIYGFRGCVDAVATIGCDRTLPLTTSFRFAPLIAERANALVRGWDPRSSLDGGRGDPGSLPNPTIGGASHVSSYSFHKMESAKQTFSEVCNIIASKKDATCGLVFRTRAGLLSYLFHVDKQFHVRINNLSQLQSAMEKALRHVNRGTEPSGDGEDEDGIGALFKVAKQFTTLCELFVHRKNCPWKPASMDKRLESHPLTAMTVHGAKGLEFDIVVIGDDIGDPFANSTSMEDMTDAERHNFQREVAEEMHIANVALTRTKRFCYNHSTIIERAINKGFEREKHNTIIDRAINKGFERESK